MKKKSFIGYILHNGQKVSWFWSDFLCLQQKLCLFINHYPTPFPHTSTTSKITVKFPPFISTKFNYQQRLIFIGITLKNIWNRKIKKLEAQWCHSPFILLWGNLIQNLPWVLPAKFRFIWLLSFRGEDYLEIDQSERRIACGGHIC